MKGGNVKLGLRIYIYLHYIQTEDLGQIDGNITWHINQGQYRFEVCIC